MHLLESRLSFTVVRVQEEDSFSFRMPCFFIYHFLFVVISHESYLLSQAPDVFIRDAQFSACHHCFFCFALVPSVVFIDELDATLNQVGWGIFHNYKF